MRRLRTGVLAATLAVAVSTPALGLATAGPAQAAAYRYWSYWTVSNSGEWRYAQTGDAEMPAREGSVHAWRFAISTSARSTTPPRLDAAAAFNRACDGVEAPAGQHRVALVLDFGTAADTRPGDALPDQPLRHDCVVTTATTGRQVMLQTGVTLRFGRGGMVCGLAGYPSVGCGEPVAAPKPSSTDPRPTRAAGSTGSGSAGSGSAGSGAGGSGATTGDGSNRTPKQTGAPRDRSSGGTEASSPPRGTTPAASGSTTAAATTASRAPSAAGPGSAAPATGPTGVEAAPEPVEGLPTGGASDGSPLPVLAALLVLVAVGSGALLTARRRNRGAGGGQAP